MTFPYRRRYATASSSALDGMAPATVRRSRRRRSSATRWMRPSSMTWPGGTTPGGDRGGAWDPRRPGRGERRVPARARARGPGRRPAVGERRTQHRRIAASLAPEALRRSRWPSTGCAPARRARPSRRSSPRPRRVPRLCLSGCRGRVPSGARRGPGQARFAGRGPGTSGRLLRIFRAWARRRGPGRPPPLHGPRRDVPIWPERPSDDARGS